MNNSDLMKAFPDFQKELDALNSESFHEYEDKLNKVTNKAIDALKSLIDDGTLSLDPEQLINAVKVLTKARTDIMDSKRKLSEMLVRSEVMLRAIEPPKGNGNETTSLLQDYMTKIDNSGKSMWDGIDGEG